MTIETAGPRLNPFWTDVCASTCLVETCLVVSPPSISASDLAAATREAFGRTGSSHAFRRPRELVDLTGRFRHFAYAGKPFVGKRSSSSRAALREADNAREAAARLEQVDDLHPVVPTMCMEHGDLLVSPDSGPSLAHDADQVSRILGWEALLTTMGELVAVGIEWPGFLPRNVLSNGTTGFRLIDWERSRFEARDSPCRAIGDLTLLFWSIAWAGYYGLDTKTFQQEVCEHLCLARRIDPLDQFERTYASITGTEHEPFHVRDRCTTATIATECADFGGPVAGRITGCEGPLTPADVGHLLNELLPPHLSVVYTFAAQHYVETQGRRSLQTFVCAMNRALVLGTPYEGLEGDVAGQKRLQLLLTGCMAGVLLDEASAHQLTGARTISDLVDHLQDASPIVGELIRIADGNARGPLDGERLERSVDYIVEVAAEALMSAAGLSADPTKRSRLPGVPAIRSELMDVVGGARVW